jgi:hypothetical protein
MRLKTSGFVSGLQGVRMPNVNVLTMDYGLKQESPMITHEAS